MNLIALYAMNYPCKSEFKIDKKNKIKNYFLLFKGCTLIVQLLTNLQGCFIPLKICNETDEIDIGHTKQF